jgi:hypothetical protein
MSTLAKFDRKQTSQRVNLIVIQDSRNLVQLNCLTY